MRKFPHCLSSTWLLVLSTSVMLTCCLTTYSSAQMSIGSQPKTKVRPLKDMFDMEWVKQYDSPNVNHAISSGPSGIVLAGSGSQSIRIGHQRAIENKFIQVQRYLLDGRLLWSKRFGHEPYVNANATHIGGIIGYDRSLYVTGSLMRNGLRKGFLRMYRMNGELLWDKSIEIQDPASPELIADETISFAMVDDASGQYFYISGWSKGGSTNCSFNRGCWFLRKYDRAGNLVWVPDQNEFESLHVPYKALARDSTGIYGIGTYQAVPGEYYIPVGVIEKWSFEGDLLWSIYNEGNTDLNDPDPTIIKGIAVHETHGIFTTGMRYVQEGHGADIPYQQLGFFLRNHDPETGDLIWSKHISGLDHDEKPTQIAVDSQGIYVALNSSNHPPDIVFLHFDLQGSLLSRQEVGTAFDDVVEDMTVSSSGVYLVGQTDGQFPTQTNRTGAKNGFLMKLTRDEDLVKSVECSWLDAFKGRCRKK